MRVYTSKLSGHVLIFWCWKIKIGGACVSCTPAALLPCLTSIDTVKLQNNKLGGMCLQPRVQFCSVAGFSARRGDLVTGEDAAGVWAEVTWSVPDASLLSHLSQERAKKSLNYHRAKT